VQTEGRFSYFYDLLTPFFFIHIGMQTDLLLMIQSFDVGLVLFIAASLSKLVFTAVPAMLSMSRNDALKLGVSMIPWAEIALVVIYECRAVSDQVVSSEVFAGMVLVSIVTSTVSPIVLRRMLRTSPPV
jgi:Kef-type K+ transport system membrane component KefB